jgi:hypothetical protein
VNVTPTGLETTANSSENQGVSEQGNVKCNVIVDENTLNEADRASLRIIMMAWTCLSQAEKQAILAIVRRASDAAA